MIVLTYIVSVLVKWGWEMLGWVDQNRDKGIAGWWAQDKYRFYRKALLHVILGTLWSMGLLLEATNTAFAAVGIGALASVTWQSTLAAGFMIDTIGKPIIEKMLSLWPAQP